MRKPQQKHPSTLLTTDDEITKQLPSLTLWKTSILADPVFPVASGQKADVKKTCMRVEGRVISLINQA